RTEIYTLEALSLVPPIVEDWHTLLRSSLTNYIDPTLAPQFNQIRFKWQSRSRDRTGGSHLRLDAISAGKVSFVKTQPAY
ncbi:hypothetical protein TSAR_012402, partial [Trichomalopsis sarcophagae]